MPPAGPGCRRRPCRTRCRDRATPGGAGCRLLTAAPARSTRWPWTSATTWRYRRSDCMVRGSPRMCMSTMPAPRSATSSNIPGSEPAVTSLTRSAPASRAAAATSVFEVSTDSTVSGEALRSSAMTGHDAPPFLGRVDRRGTRTGGFAADIDDRGAVFEQFPARAERRRRAAKWRPPSEKESGVQLRMPITAGRGRGQS